LILVAFERLEKGDMSVRVQLKAAREFNDLMEGFNKMVERLGGLIDRVYKQEIYAQRVELKQLQSQINPHFLYNSYFMLHRMIKERDFENADALSSYLGKYFRYITKNDSDEVPLEVELEHSRSYVEIQVMRFSTRLSAEFGELPENLKNLEVPRLIIQPIFENSIEHGVKSTLKNGLIRLSISEVNDFLCVTIEDNGSNLGDDDIEKLHERLNDTRSMGEATGLVNVHRRIRLRFGDSSGVSVSRSDLGGLKVDIKINLKEENKNV
jgi:two-component system sensor histidine kinase YesM